MADAKISALPAATTPLAGTEVLPIVQGGATDKVSVANLTAGRDVDVKKLISTEDVGIGTATPATGSMSNSAVASAGVFSTLRGSVASASGVPVTIATANQNHPLSTYIVSCGVSSGAPTAYSAVSIVSADNNTLRITNLQTATNMTISVSGTDIQATQTSGGTPSILFAITRVA